MATPSPLSRPALLRMSRRERCPKTTARIDAGKKKKKSPEIRLAIAFPLVSGVTPCPAAAAAVADVETSFPHTRQKRSPDDTLFPQAGQNTVICLRRGPAADSLRANFAGTLLHASFRVNSPSWFVPQLRRVCQTTPHFDKVRHNTPPPCRSG